MIDLPCVLYRTSGFRHVLTNDGYREINYAENTLDYWIDTGYS